MQSRRTRYIYILLAALLPLAPSIHAQAPETLGSAEIFLRLKKLNVLGTVLYVAAHPDDENSRLIAYMAKERLYRTGYLSMTRGDGGQNLVGKLLPMLAPIVLSYLASRVSGGGGKTSAVSGGGMEDLLGGLLGGVLGGGGSKGGGGIGDLLGGLLGGGRR